jgi:hypothetical protein
MQREKCVKKILSLRIIMTMYCFFQSFFEAADTNEGSILSMSLDENKVCGR